MDDVKEREENDSLISMHDAIEVVRFGITYAKRINVETGEAVEIFKRENQALEAAIGRIMQLPQIPVEWKQLTPARHAEKTGRLVMWQYCRDPNDINKAIMTRDEDWNLAGAEDIISITWDGNHNLYVVFYFEAPQGEET